MRQYDPPKISVFMFRTEEVLSDGSDIIDLPVIPFSVRSETKTETPSDLGHPAN